MANTITAGNSTNNGFAVAGDNTGTLDIKTGSGAGTTAISIDASQNVAIAGSLTVTGSVVSSGSGYASTTYTSPTTWAKPAGLKAIKVTVVAGGAGGTGNRGPFPGGITSSGGGASLAGYAYLPAASIPSSPISVTVGTGGAGGGIPGTVQSKTPGAPGGTSSFGAFITATGGLSGPNVSNAGPGGMGSWSSSVPASNQFAYVAPTFDAAIGTGRDSSASMGYGGLAGTGTSENGRGYGAGGSGSSNPNVSNSAGGDGAPGVVIIEEFY